MDTLFLCFRHVDGLLSLRLLCFRTEKGQSRDLQHSDSRIGICKRGVKTLVGEERKKKEKKQQKEREWPALAVIKYYLGRVRFI